MSLKERKSTKLKRSETRVGSPKVLHSLRAVLLTEAVDHNIPLPDLSNYDDWDHKFFDLSRKAQIDTYFNLGIVAVDDGAKDYLKKIDKPLYVIASKYGKSKIYVNRDVLKKYRNVGQRIMELWKRYME